VTYQKRLLQFLDDLIDDKILELYPVEGGGFKKLKSIARLLDGKEAKLDRFLKPTEDDLAEAKERAMQFNELMEHLSALKPTAPTYKQQVRGSSKAPSRQQPTTIPDTASQRTRPSTFTNSDQGSDSDVIASTTSSGHSARGAEGRKPHVRFQDESEEIEGGSSAESITTEEALNATLYDERDLPPDTR
jgi:hypothetical protein